MLVTLIDGTEAASDSEAWRHECEARTVLAMPSKSDRRCYLYGYTDVATNRQVRGVLQNRGQDEVKRLEITIRKIWDMRRAAKN